MSVDTGSRLKRALRSASAARALFYIELACLGAGVALLGFYAVARVDSFIGRARALEAFEQEVAGSDELAIERAQAHEPTAAATLPDPGTPDQALWGKTRIAAYQKGLAAAGTPPLGVLGIPKLKLRAPVFEGTDELSLNRGVGRIEGTARIGAAGNLGIAGHRDGFFRGLKDIALDDVLEVQTVDGTVRYRVTELLIVEPEDVYVLDPTDRATLTLVTCYPFYFVGDAPQRFIVKAAAEGFGRRR